jgi:hypothetical protein
MRKGLRGKSAQKPVLAPRLLGNCSTVFGTAILDRFLLLLKLMLSDTASSTAALTTKIPY